MSGPLCVRVIEVVFLALDGERKIVDATEAGFRRRVLESLNQIASVAAQTQDADRLVEAAMLSLPPASARGRFYNAFDLVNRLDGRVG